MNIGDIMISGGVKSSCSNNKNCGINEKSDKL